MDEKLEDKKVSRRNSTLLAILLVLSVVTTIGIWYYQDTQLKDMEELLMIANDEYAVLNEEYAVLEDMYVELGDVYVKLDEEHTQLNIEYTNLIGDYNTLDDIHTELEDSIPGIIEESFATGYHEGNETGYEQGVDDGAAVGYTIGYDIGQEDGFADGQEDGWRMGYTLGNKTGYDLGHLDGAEAYAVGDYDGLYWFLRDPTYGEVREFIITDRTDRMTYNTDIFNCGDYTFTVRNNAAYRGYRSFGVYVGLEGSAHMIVGFNTTDRGMVFIDPQNDYFVELEVGVSYWKTALQSPHTYRPSYSDVIVRWNIHW